MRIRIRKKDFERGRLRDINRASASYLRNSHNWDKNGRPLDYHYDNNKKKRERSCDEEMRKMDNLLRLNSWSRFTGLR